MNNFKIGDFVICVNNLSNIDSCNKNIGNVGKIIKILKNNCECLERTLSNYYSFYNDKYFLIGFMGNIGHEWLVSKEIMKI